MRDADHFNALQDSYQQPEEGKTDHHCPMKRGEKQRPVPYAIEKLERSQD